MASCTQRLYRLLEERMSRLTKFKSNERLQADALDVLNELVGRGLLVVDVPIVTPFSSLGCRPTEAYITGSRSLSGTDAFRAAVTGEMPEKNKHAGVGISLSLRQQFRFGSPAEEQQASEALEEALRKPSRGGPTTIESLTSLATPQSTRTNVLLVGFGIYLAISAAYLIGTALNTLAVAFHLQVPILVWLAAMGAFCGTIFFLDNLNSPCVACGRGR
jgi:hypothetical protein